MTTNMQDHKVAKLIRSLLGGQPPNGVNPQECGPWTATVTALYNAHSTGGTARVREEFIALVNQNPDLTNLISGEPITKTRWTVEELYATQFPALQFIVPGLVPAGIISLAGRPKVGKSWLALQIAHAVGTGGQTLGQTVAAGKVLYLALEDHPRRLKTRCLKQHIPKEAQITFVTAWKPFDRGGIADLEIAICTGRYNLVIVDTLSRAFGRADQLVNREMNILMGELHQLVQENDLTLLLIDHHRKPSFLEADPIDDILGSTAKSAGVDASLGLYKQRGQPGATLKVTGRDVEEKGMALQWAPALYCWQCLGEANHVAKATVQQEIQEAMAARDGQATVSELAADLGKTPGNILREVKELISKGKVKRGERNGRHVPYLLME